MEDNLLAAYFDKKLSPLESLVYKDDFQKLKNSEISIIMNDIKEVGFHIEAVSPIDIPACREYLSSLSKWKEFSDHPDSNSSKIV